MSFLLALRIFFPVVSFTGMCVCICVFVLFLSRVFLSFFFNCQDTIVVLPPLLLVLFIVLGGVVIAGDGEGVAVAVLVCVP